MKSFFKIILLAACFAGIIFSCKKKATQNPSNPVPNVSVNINIYPNDPIYATNIGVTGGWVYLTGGNKGLIVYRKSQTDFVAMDRTCTYDPNTKYLLKVLSDNITVKDTCGSKFLLLDGGVTNGPASQGLKTYGTSYDGTTLHIYN